MRPRKIGNLPDEKLVRFWPLLADLGRSVYGKYRPKADIDEQSSV